MDRLAMPDVQLILMSLAQLRPGLTAEELKEYAVKSLYADFFQASEALASLLAEDLLSETTRHDEKRRDINGNLLPRIDITSKGEAVLTTLRHQLPQPIQAYLRQFLEEETQTVEELIADFMPDSKQGWVVRLGHHNGKFSVIKLELNVPNREQAEIFVANWRSKYTDIYGQLIEQLADNS